MEPNYAANAAARTACSARHGGHKDQSGLRPLLSAPNGEVALWAGPAARGARSATWAVHAGPVVGLIAQVLLLATLAGTIGLGGADLGGKGWIVGVTCGVDHECGTGARSLRFRSDRLTPADWVTLARATLAVGVAALVADSFDQSVPSRLLVTLAALALVLDAIDGWVARRTTTAALGARFDGEVDAFLILVLSVYVARSAGAWVLAIGVARYAFLAAEWPLAWMRAPLPPRYWRKVVAATQGIVLTVAAADVLPPALTRAALIVALGLLAESFGRDVLWLRRERSGDNRRIARVISRTPEPDSPGGPPRGRVRRGVAATLTILGALAVWTVLVAPYEPKDLTLSGFLTIPLEGLVLVALAAVLPRTPRRILAVSGGLVLALVVV